MQNLAFERWLLSPQGEYVLGWERRQIDVAVADVFGYNALQLGLTQVDLLEQNRIPFRQRLGTLSASGGIDVDCDLHHLPIAANSIDLVILPHLLEFAAAPHQILREVERVLIPEGQVVISGFNPFSLWGARRKMAWLFGAAFPWQGQYLGVRRLRDWLQLLGFEVATLDFGCYAPPCTSQRWLWRWRHLEAAGRRIWPFAGAVYVVRAQKHVPAMRLILPASWNKERRRAKALSPLTQKEEPHGR